MPPRRRVRKRKQRNVSASSSSSSSSSASDDEITPKIAPQPVVESASEESDTDSSSAISSAAATTIPLATVSKKPTQDERVPSRSPSPPIANIPPMFPPSADGPSEKERALKEKFKKLWMASLADTFKDELEQIRKVAYFLFYSLCSESDTGTQSNHLSIVSAY